MESGNGDILAWALWTFTSVLTTGAGVMAFKFDLNRWLERQRKMREKQLKSLCPHVKLWGNRDGIRVKPLFVSPLGTVAWICQRCGARAYGEDQIDDIAQYWAEHIDQYAARVAHDKQDQA